MACSPWFLPWVRHPATSMKSLTRYDLGHKDIPAIANEPFGPFRSSAVFLLLVS